MLFMPNLSMAYPENGVCRYRRSDGHVQPKVQQCCQKTAVLRENALLFAPEEYYTTIERHCGDNSLNATNVPYEHWSTLTTDIILHCLRRSATWLKLHCSLPVS